jgi:hypothetical protein
MIKRLYRCESCFAFYEDRNRVRNCHPEGFTEWDGEMQKKRGIKEAFGVKK